MTSTKGSSVPSSPPAASFLSSVCQASFDAPAFLSAGEIASPVEQATTGRPQGSLGTLCPHSGSLQGSLLWLAPALEIAPSPAFLPPLSWAGGAPVSFAQADRSHTEEMNGDLLHSDASNLGSFSLDPLPGDAQSGGWAAGGQGGLALVPTGGREAPKAGGPRLGQTRLPRVSCGSPARGSFSGHLLSTSCFPEKNSRSSWLAKLQAGCRPPLPAAFAMLWCLGREETGVFVSTGPAMEELSHSHESQESKSSLGWESQGALGEEGAALAPFLLHPASQGEGPTPGYGLGLAREGGLEPGMLCLHRGLSPF